jgi:prophage regulatory protein
MGLESDVFTNTTEPFLRLPEVLRIIPVSRSTWYAGIQAGDYPAPVKLGLRAAAWRRSDIEKLAASFTNEPFSPSK